MLCLIESLDELIEVDCVFLEQFSFNPNEPSDALKQPTFFSKFWFLLPVAQFL